MSADEEMSSEDPDYNDEGDESSSEEEECINGITEPQAETKSKNVRAEAKWPSDKIIVTQITKDGMPIPRKEKLRLRLVAGLTARQKVSLLHKKFDDLGQQGKEALFDDNVIPYLHFSEEMKEKGMKRTLKAINKCWRSYKSTLVNKYMLQNKSPYKRYKHLKKEDYEAFVRMKQTEEFMRKSEKYKLLRSRNKHNHHLGTGGYEGKIETWLAEDQRLAEEGRPNPWLDFPTIRSKNWLRARGKLTDSGEISFNSEATKQVAERIKQHSDNDSTISGQDALSKALGNSEHPGRVRGISSYVGWKLGWPGYNKRRKITADELDELSEALRKKVTQDIVANIPDILAAQGLKIVPINQSPSGRSSFSSIQGGGGSGGGRGDRLDNHVDMMQLDDIVQLPDELNVGQLPNEQLEELNIGQLPDDQPKELNVGQLPSEQPGSTSLLSEPAPCSLLGIVGGYQLEVGRGEVCPKRQVLHNVEVPSGYVVVQVQYVHSKYEDFLLEIPPDDEITTLGDALLTWVQWRKSLIVLNPGAMEIIGNMNPLNNPPKPVCNIPAKKVDSLDEKDKQSKKAMETKSSSGQGSVQGKVKAAPTNSANAVVRVDSKKKGSVSETSVWARPHSKFKLGMSLLTEADAKTAGPFTHKLHTAYMNGCKNKKRNFLVHFKAQHFLKREEDKFIVAYADLYDLFRFDALDMSILRIFALYTAKEARLNKLPVAVLDPQMLALTVIENDHDGEVSTYVARAMSHCARNQKDFIMFPCNTGGHWIAVVLHVKWGIIWYLDSNFQSIYDISPLKNLLDKAYSTYVASDQTKRKKGKVVLKHMEKFQCHQQTSGNECGFYAIHHILFVASASSKMQKPEDFVVPTEPLDKWVLAGHREQIAGFMVNDILHAKGEFHLPTVMTVM